MAKQSVRDIDVSGKRVLVRVDFNVPFTKDGKIADDTRISAALPTINYLLEHNAAVILCTHLGRPDGKVVDSLRLTPVADRLARLLGKDIQTAPDCVGPQAEAAAHALSPGEVLLLENLRFHPEEEKNDPRFAESLASLANVYVNDAFGTAHRAHASTAGVAAFLPAVAGFLMLKEVEELGNVLGKPERPMTAIIGGAKISSKLGVVTNLLQRVDCLLLGGGMASTFIKARGMEVGDSLVEEDMLDAAKDLMYQAERRGVPLMLPTDAVVADAFAAEAAYQTVPVSAIPVGWRVMDVGPDSIAHFKDALEDCKTVFWNGPLGVAEFPAFAKGSEAMAQVLADLDARVVIGGGETSALVEQMDLHDRYTHVSTGGGASLEFIEGKTLPGVAALLDK
jgi:phosphoglycerate kinase